MLTSLVHSLRTELLLLALCLSHDLAQCRIVGLVTDQEGRPTSSVVVLATCAASGVPVNSDGIPITQAFSAKFEFAGAISDEKGSFTIHIAAGLYNLHAQKAIDPQKPWRGLPGSSIFPLFGDTVALYGVARNVQVPTQAPRVLLSPAGTGSVTLDLGFPNDDAIVVASLEAPELDPVFGFLAWKGRFLLSALAMNRMPRGKTTFRNLPEGTVHLAVFANDNRSGFAVTSATVVSGRATTATGEIVASWSNARHTPPSRLQPLAARILKQGWSLTDMVGFSTASVSLSLGSHQKGERVDRFIKRHGGPDTLVQLPDGSSAPLRDILTVFAYQQLQTSARVRR